MKLVIVVGLLLLGWVEISVFNFVSNEVGGFLTLLGVFLTAIIGITLLKSQGLSVLYRVRSDLAKGHPPITSIADTISLVVGAGLMLIPGYVTDGVGILLFIPGFRTMAGMYIRHFITKKPHFTGFVDFSGITFKQENDNQNRFGFNKQHNQQNDFDDIIEGEFEERPEDEFPINQKNKYHQDDC